MEGMPGGEEEKMFSKKKKTKIGLSEAGVGLVEQQTVDGAIWAIEKG